MTWATTVWTAVLLGAAGCALLKWAGYLVPAAVLDRPGVRITAGLLPVALLSALVVVQTFATGTTLQVDARLAGLVVAMAALMLRAPFLVVVLAAAITAAALRAVGWAA